MSSRLKPCPFCGSPAEHYPDGEMEGYDVMCSSTTSDCKFNVFGSRTPAQAEALWNRRAAPGVASATALDSESLLKAVNAIARQLIDEQSAAPADVDEEDFAAGKMAGTVQFAAEMIKHIQLASASTTMKGELSNEPE
ncbi:hypothetical protein GJ698_14905 [Pseudoduganella sp. FT26W]|uniref:Restriction alleviation protein, Lar family n=1 Tax=Duganella aquatilis TaxID=2666082 RepID=A0A844CY56_9BURK|nr:Lar family restriction alleviation protein [Duganella aquatilis]MRW85373.1 hypothetical protein [Duganella aquatilis]